MELRYDLTDPCVSVLFITIDIYSPSLGKCATGSIVFSICTSYERKKETIIAKLFFQDYYTDLFLEIYFRPTNDRQKRLKYPL